MPEPESIKRIRAALERDRDIDLHHNKIDISQNGSLRLEGEVDTIITKRRAMQVARAAAEGATVEDRLLLHTELKRQGPALQQAALDALTREPVFRDFVIRAKGTDQPASHDWIEVSVQGNRVRLDGEVFSLSHRRLAEVIVWWVPGTADVDNRLHVQPQQQDTDDEISDAIRLVFGKDPSLDAEQIQIMTRDGAVHLQGVVSSEVNRRIASYDCWYIPGVHSVINDLQVRPNS